MRSVHCIIMVFMWAVFIGALLLFFKRHYSFPAGRIPKDKIFLKKESPIPFGGIILAMTWGMFHFVSRGVGIEIWNGISTMIFSVLSGEIYLKLNRR